MPTINRDKIAKSLAMLTAPQLPSAPEFVEEEEERIAKAAAHKYSRKYKGPHGWVYVYEEDHGHYHVGQHTAGAYGGKKWRTEYHPGGSEEGKYFVNNHGVRAMEVDHGGRWGRGVIGHDADTKKEATARVGRHHEIQTKRSANLGSHGTLADDHIRSLVSNHLTSQMRRQSGASRTHTEGMLAMLGKIEEGATAEEAKKTYAAVGSIRGQLRAADRAGAAYEKIRELGDVAHNWVEERKAAKKAMEHPTFTKGGGGGWEAIPGGHSNGQRRRKAGGGYEYRYEHGTDHLDHLHGKLRSHLNYGRGEPDRDHLPHPHEVQAMVQAAVEHGKKRGNKGKTLARLRELQSAARESANKTTTYRGKGRATRDHEMHARAVRDHIVSGVSELRDHGKKPKAKPENTHPGQPDSGPAEGKHRTATRTGYEEVDTVHSAGHYHVHGGPRLGSITGRNADDSYSVTHGPSGLKVGSARTKAQAVRFADHMHRHAGDAGANATFGDAASISSADMKRLGDAHGAFRRSMPPTAWGDNDQIGILDYSPEEPLVKSEARRPSGRPAGPLDSADWCHLWNQE